MEIPFIVIPRLSGTVNTYPGVANHTAWDRHVLVATQDVDGYFDGELAQPVPSGISISEAAILFEIASIATTGVSRWSVAAAAIAAGESFDPASLNAETAQDLNIPNVSGGYGRVSARFPSAGSLVITVAPGDIVIARFFHEGAHANDTVAAATLFSHPRLLIVES